MPASTPSSALHLKKFSADLKQLFIIWCTSYRVIQSLTYLCQIVVICKAEEVVDASVSTTDDNAAYGGKMVQIRKEMIETVHKYTK